jgi:hypothetical protein
LTKKAARTLSIENVPLGILKLDRLPSAETAAMLFWALLASGQITMRKVDLPIKSSTLPHDQIS